MNIIIAIVTLVILFSIPYFFRENENTIKYPLQKKICIQYQPFKIDNNTYTACNFPCDGNCKFKNSKYYINKNG